MDMEDIADNIGGAESIPPHSLLYKKTFGVMPDYALPLAGAGSDRRYTRLGASGCPTVIATEGDDLQENAAFTALARMYREEGHNVPAIYAVSPDGGCYLQEDLGDTQLLTLLKGEERMALSEKTLAALAALQTVRSRLWEGLVMAKPFSRRLVMWDLNYFKYGFLKPAGITFDEEALEDDFSSIADTAGADLRLWGFMYRDCQSRNVMIRDGEPWWIDFQGGRRGPMVYDAVSFLWQSKAAFTADERRHLLNVYARALSERTGVACEDILAQATPLVLLRTLQVLGAYGFRGLIEKKAHFIESIPGAIRNLGEMLDKGGLIATPELERIARKLVASRFNAAKTDGPLVVKVFSFSYKKGYPEDLSGNGGGFMFDCRGMHNPGRYDEFKPLTGLDKEVIDFLKSKGETDAFVDKALDIVSPSIERYLKRGFSSLQVGFGCTGGRHRSVYCAQAFAEKASSLFPDVVVELIHREQGIHKFFNRSL